MSAFVLNRKYELQLPERFVDVDREEMEYVDGGFAIGKDFAASAFNVAIGIAVGGGVGAIQSFIINKGKQEAKRIFTRTVTSKLIAWGANNLAWIVGTAVSFALDYCNIGNAIATYIDNHDTYHGNGWLG
jgi:hypothetical protein